MQEVEMGISAFLALNKDIKKIVCVESTQWVDESIQIIDLYAAKETSLGLTLYISQAPREDLLKLTLENVLQMRDGIKDDAIAMAISLL